MGRRDDESRRDEGGAAAQPGLHGVQIFIGLGGLGIVALMMIAAVGVFCAIAVDVVSSKFRRGEPRMRCGIWQIRAADDVRLRHRIFIYIVLRIGI